MKGLARDFCRVSLLLQSFGGRSFSFANGLSRRKTPARCFCETDSFFSRTRGSAFARQLFLSLSLSLSPSLTFSFSLPLSLPTSFSSPDLKASKFFWQRTWKSKKQEIFFLLVVVVVAFVITVVVVVNVNVVVVVVVNDGDEKTRVGGSSSSRHRSDRNRRKKNSQQNFSVDRFTSEDPVREKKRQPNFFSFSPLFRTKPSSRRKIRGFQKKSVSVFRASSSFCGKPVLLQKNRHQEQNCNNCIWVAKWEKVEKEIVWLKLLLHWSLFNVVSVEVVVSVVVDFDVVVDAVAAVVDDISAADLVAAVAVVFYFNETLFIESFVALHSDWQVSFLPRFHVQFFIAFISSWSCPHPIHRVVPVLLFFASAGIATHTLTHAL